MEAVTLDVLRGRLGRMTGRLIFRLEDRSIFPQNQNVYIPGAVPLHGYPNLSFLEYGLQGLESFHDTLGRYEYPDQFRITRADQLTHSVDRVVHVPGLPKVEIDIRQKLMSFYTDILIPQLCLPGDDVDTYGETVYLDADLLVLLHERINIGRYVAQVKADANPDLWRMAVDTAAVRAHLTDSAQEERITQGALDVAEVHKLTPDVTRLVFRWVIDTTLDVEVAYLQGLLTAPDR